MSISKLLQREFFFQTIVTGAGDETLRFWNVFPSPKSQVNDYLDNMQIERNSTLDYVRSFVFFKYIDRNHWKSLSAMAPWLLFLCFQFHI